MAYTVHSIILDFEDRIRKNDQHNTSPSDEFVCNVTDREVTSDRRYIKTYSGQYP